jgi:hypothetical protein
MSVSPNFLSRFCQAPPPPVVYTGQDIVNDFMKKIEEVATQSQTSEVYVKYVFPDKFKTTFLKEGFWKIIQNTLVNQMNCIQIKNRITFSHEHLQMTHKSFYYFKTNVSYQYNEKYFHDSWCTFEDEPDGILLKLYVQKN